MQSYLPTAKSWQRQNLKKWRVEKSSPLGSDGNNVNETWSTPWRRNRVGVGNIRITPGRDGVHPWNPWIANRTFKLNLDHRSQDLGSGWPICHFTVLPWVFGQETERDRLGHEVVGFYARFLLTSPIVLRRITTCKIARRRVYVKSEWEKFSNVHSLTVWKIHLSKMNFFLLVFLPLRKLLLLFCATKGPFFTFNDWILYDILRASVLHLTTTR